MPVSKTDSMVNLEGAAMLSKMQAGYAHGLHPSDLQPMMRKLSIMREYFEHDGECVQRINDCIEVIQGLADLWARESLRNERSKQAERCRELKPAKQAGRELTSAENEALLNLAGVLPRCE